jgi:hypothetical protein
VKELTIGTIRYVIEASSREGQWYAHVQQSGAAGRFGPECAGDSESDAIARMAAWLEWQYEHAAALEDLQRAERAYHRTIAGSAFASPVEGPGALEMQKESLEAVEAARVRLDEIRARRPDCH